MRRHIAFDLENIAKLHHVSGMDEVKSLMGNSFK